MCARHWGSIAMPTSYCTLVQSSKVMQSVMTYDLLWVAVHYLTLGVRAAAQVVGRQAMQQSSTRSAQILTDVQQQLSFWCRKEYIPRHFLAVCFCVNFWLQVLNATCNVLKCLHTGKLGRNQSVCIHATSLSCWYRMLYSNVCFMSVLLRPPLTFLENRHLSNFNPEAIVRNVQEP